MSSRRYGDDEVREIFRLATTGESGNRSLPAESGGLTLDQLQQIGQEAGIEPGRVAQAAAQLEVRGQPAPIRRSLGMPIGVSRVVDLPRAPTDREWERLVAEFRTTFGAQGRATSTGGLREWSQGNLHISLEPTEHGERLRLSTIKGNARALNRFAFIMGAVALVMGAVAAADGKPAKALAVLGMFGGFALVAFLANLVRLPGWARERERQMASVGEYAVTLLTEKS